MSDEAEQFLYSFIEDLNSETGDEEGGEGESSEDEGNTGGGAPQQPQSGSSSFASAFQFADTSARGFEDHKIKYIQRNGYEYVALDLGEDKAKYLKSVTFLLYMCDDGLPTIFLGENPDVLEDWENGFFQDNFRGIWGSIDGHLLMLHITSITEGYVLYEASLKINGRLHNLTVAYDREDEMYKILSARLDESETGGVPARSERLLAPGDVVTTVFFALDHENNNLVPFDHETFTIQKNPTFEEAALPDGKYALLYLMTDYRDNLYFSDWAGVVMKDGKADIIDF